MAIQTNNEKPEDKVVAVTDLAISAESPAQNKEFENPEPAELQTEELSVMVNNTVLTLKGKKKYIFVDIFDYIEFDRSQVKGRLIAKKNGENTSYVEPLNENDVLEIYWE